MDYNNLQKVIEYAKKLGGSMVVKYPTRSNYNIVPEKRALPPDVKIVWRPDE